MKNKWKNIKDSPVYDPDVSKKKPHRNNRSSPDYVPMEKDLPWPTFLDGRPVWVDRGYVVMEIEEAHEIYEAIKSVVKRNNFTKKCEALWDKWNPKK